MAKRIDLFMPPKSQYGVLHAFTRCFAAALERLGVDVRLLYADYNNPQAFIDTIFASPPDCTLSFNGLLPDNKGHFFCDMIKIPHIAYLVDSPSQFVQLATCTRTVVSCIDRSFCDFFRGIKKPHVLFLPHGVDPNLAAKPDQPRKYDITMFASCIDYVAIEQNWKQYPPALQSALVDAAALALRSGNQSYVQLFVEAFDRHLRTKGGVDPRQIDFTAILQELEDYINAKERVELLKAIHCAPVHVFGSADEALWKKLLGLDYSHITFHPEIPFEEALEIMKESRIILNNSPKFRFGAHERVFSALACGAAVVTSDSVFLKETFNDELIFYKGGEEEAVNKSVKDLLTNETKRADMAARGRVITMNNHTWDHRAEVLLKALPDILGEIDRSLT